MSTRFYGSICVTDILDLAHKKHSAFNRSENGKVYADVSVWLNDEKDKYGNIMSIQLNPKKELKEVDGNPYIGNCKESEKRAINSKDVSGMALPDDIPVREKAQPGSATSASAASITEPIDDLPF